MHFKYTLARGVMFYLILTTTKINKTYIFDFSNKILSAKLPSAAFVLTDC